MQMQFQWNGGTIYSNKILNLPNSHILVSAIADPGTINAIIPMV